MPHKNKTSTDWFAPSESITWAKDWKDVSAILKADHPEGAKVAVIPDATIQFFDVVTKSPYVGEGTAADPYIE